MPRCERGPPAVRQLRAVLLLNVAAAVASPSHAGPSAAVLHSAECRADGAAGAGVRPATPLALVQTRSALERQAAAPASPQNGADGAAQEAALAELGAAAAQNASAAAPAAAAEAAPAAPCAAAAQNASAAAPAAAAAPPAAAGRGAVAGGEAVPRGVPTGAAWLQMRMSQGAGSTASDLAIWFIVMVFIAVIGCMMYHQWKLEDGMEEDKRHLHHMAVAGRRGVNAGAAAVERRTRDGERQQEAGGSQSGGSRRASKDDQGFPEPRYEQPPFHGPPLHGGFPPSYRDRSPLREQRAASKDCC